MFYWRSYKNSCINHKLKHSFSLFFCSYFLPRASKPPTSTQGWAFRAESRLKFFSKSWIRIRILPLLSSLEAFFTPAGLFFLRMPTCNNSVQLFSWRRQIFTTVCLNLANKGKKNKKQTKKMTSTFLLLTHIN